MPPLQFADPGALWWLLVPAGLLLLWTWRLGRRLADLASLRRRRTLPRGERFARAGDLKCWLAVIAAIALLALALARPVMPTPVPRRPGLDVVILLDGSASMQVADVARPSPDGRPVRTRWQRATRFVRHMGEALAWTDDRLAMVVFAHVATPQIRLTRDPNTLFFFLDHLHDRPPFRLEDDTTWDTNLEQAVAWGLRLVDKDREIRGASPNGTLFVLLSDGESWSGEVARALKDVASRGIPVFVAGVGTLGGGPLPVVRTEAGEVLNPPGVSRLDRPALQRIAAAGQGAYFELERDGDAASAHRIVAAGRRRAPMAGIEEAADEMYWWFIAAAALMAGAGLAGLRHTSELALVLGTGAAGALATAPLLW